MNPDTQTEYEYAVAAIARAHAAWLTLVFADAEEVIGHLEAAFEAAKKIHIFTDEEKVQFAIDREAEYKTDRERDEKQ